MAKVQRIKDKTSGETSVAVGKFGDGGAVNAIVEQSFGRTGARGEITQLRCKILEGSSEGKSMRRNVKGPVKVGDFLTLRETEIEARRMGSRRRRSV